jgi:hypothetical protein
MSSNKYSIYFPLVTFPSLKICQVFNYFIQYKKILKVQRKFNKFGTSSPAEYIASPIGMELNHSFSFAMDITATMGGGVPSGLVVIVLAIGLKVRRLKPSRGRWIFKGQKNP